LRAIETDGCNGWRRSSDGLRPNRVRGRPREPGFRRKLLVKHEAVGGNHDGREREQGNVARIETAWACQNEPSTTHQKAMARGSVDPKGSGAPAMAAKKSTEPILLT